MQLFLDIQVGMILAHARHGSHNFKMNFLSECHVSCECFLLDNNLPLAYCHQEYARNLSTLGVEAVNIASYRSLWQCVAPADKQNTIKL
jgi:hypothetical protein